MNGHDPDSADFELRHPLLPQCSGYIEDPEGETQEKTREEQEEEWVFPFYEVELPEPLCAESFVELVRIHKEFSILLRIDNQAVHKEREERSTESSEGSDSEYSHTIETLHSTHCTTESMVWLMQDARLCLSTIVISAACRHKFSIIPALRQKFIIRLLCERQRLTDPHMPRRGVNWHAEQEVLQEEVKSPLPSMHPHNNLPKRLLHPVIQIAIPLLVLLPLLPTLAWRVSAADNPSFLIVDQANGSNGSSESSILSSEVSSDASSVPMSSEESSSISSVVPKICYVDGDGDSFGSTATIESSDADCTDPGESDVGTDCNDVNEAIHPGAVETCDGVDDDCDTLTDEDFTDLGTTCSVGVGACSVTDIKVCTQDGTATRCNAVAGEPAADDATCNGIDDDCNGISDEDYIPVATTCGVGTCGSTGATSCVAGVVKDSCTAGAPTAELCDGLDNNCDGIVDNDADTDGDGVFNCTDNCDEVANSGQQDLDGDGAGDACDPPDCGNGFQEGDEECDDGNTSDIDSCLSTCANASCGDGFVRAGVEECDDGNGIDDDSCSNNCETPTEGTVFCNGFIATVVGNDRGNILRGTNGRDVIHGMGGSDVIFGLGGDDVLCGGAGSDVMNGGDGNDAIFGEAGRDILHGQNGSDNLDGGPDRDILNGGRGADSLDGGDGRDVCTGRGDTEVHCEI